MNRLNNNTWTMNLTKLSVVDGAAGTIDNSNDHSNIGLKFCVFTLFVFDTVSIGAVIVPLRTVYENLYDLHEEWPGRTHRPPLSIPKNHEPPNPYNEPTSTSP